MMKGPERGRLAGVSPAFDIRISQPLKTAYSGGISVTQSGRDAQCR
jgi:hypothetical protein